ncbi:laminin subunit alpha-5 isoform X1 [Rhinichthys klamathensis goyatoka]|uniref:laminin subunit alpha-5 isoform X1 n=1 Tax=Rhinichthys klamathensis goyatoka TaxID=3034132 RepID=UPI0024B5C45E|nr:laminin subunit alpha-5 isoform X1 [Rhinichthys klamathensis goyatoka]
MARGTSRAPVLVFLSLLFIETLTAQELPTGGVNGYSLHPPYFNLAEGTKITATATCGVDENEQPIQDLYCKLVGGPVSGDPSQTIQGQYCDICTSEDTNRAHPISNAIDGTERWWQSPPLSRNTKYNEVNVTLDLGQLFHVAYVLIKFANSPRPDLWVLERSIDFGKTYQPWKFFASSKRDCIERFGKRTIERINHDDDIICTTEYSRIVPLENGEIVVSLVNGRPGAMNFSYSPVLREFTKATNIRLRFLRTNTLLGHLMGKALRDPTVTRRYYYSIKDISIGGRCVCNGHAEACNAQDPNDPYKLLCDCQHNTCGPSCDRCCPGFNQFPWKPATTYSANECEPCNCHRHSSECYYDPKIDQQRASLSMQGEYRGGGVCIECQHHTTGMNCEHCIPGYYRSPDHPLESPVACSKCQCESEFTDGTCEDLTGRCYCKPNYTGENCDACAEGYERFPDCYQVYISGEARPAGEIINCECSAAGTEGNSCRTDPRTNTCVCKPQFTGEHCDTCAYGHFGLNCQRCQCSGQGCLDGSCDAVTGQCVCRSGFQGYSCEQCAPGYFNYPLCQYCGCSLVGSMPEMCDVAGQCLCRPEFTGPRCEQCRSGFHSYPNCQDCTCDPHTSLDSSCSVSGQCNCRPNYSGPKCDQCAPGYYSYPSCTPCRCSVEGSRFSSCDPVSGQCVCLPNIEGQRCDSCMPGSYGFPLCQVGTCNPAGSVHNDILPTVGSCECRPNVEGVACDRCKPLFWNLSPNTDYGCSTCDCNTVGTMSEVAECTQSTGQCYCKPNVCSGTCSGCKDGYFNLQKNNYFGCQGCQCDIGGSVRQACDERHGRCQCRPNVEGPKCNQPRPDHYFPDLHHMKFEVEDGTTMDGRPVRFGYNPLEFESFSWRGYAQMSLIQPRVLVEVVVGSPDLFHVVLHYVNRGGMDVRGRVSVIEDGRHFLCGNCSEQSKQIVFAPSSEPTFVNVPQNSFVEPFVLNPGTWTVIIEAEGILLDYLVLLPSAYYEAPILQLQVTEPCSYSNTQSASQNCLQYMYLSLDEFPSISCNEASCRFDNHLPRPCQTEKITPRHPSMAICSGNDMNVQLRGRVPVPGEYVLVVEYASEDQAPQTLTVSVNSPGEPTHQEQITLLHCKYSFLCRAVSVDDMKRVAVFTLSEEADIQLIATDRRSSFFLHKVFLVPRAQFTMEYLKPRVHCISTHGHFSPDSGSCIPSRFQNPPQSLVLKEGQASSAPEQILASAPDPSLYADRPITSRPPTAADNSEHVLLDPNQNAVVYSTRVHALGRYVFILHYHQPLHPTYNVQVYINGGRIWQGHVNASFCPHGYGCRSVVMSENQIILDVTDHEVILTLRVPDRKTLWLDYVLVVPESTYSSSFLFEEPLDKSYDFISNCGQNSFYINPSTASAFCRSSAVSLSAFFNNGAVPCGCHEVGAESDTCETFGGQCKCKPNVIGRDCSQCATGYYGFPNCRPCNCGTRLCEPVTGECICPPRTILPECVACEPQTFGCHPLVGCEVCNCSRPGVTSLDISCDTHNGQCRCKNNIVGRQCDRCSPGFYGYPNCRPCDCNEAGTEIDVCDSFTGRCLCKENVEGARCDQCKLGTFHLDPTNAKGCTKCFCFGATDRCRSSDKRRSEIMDMAGWVLLRSDRQEVPVSPYLDQDLVEADLSDVPDVSQDLHWHAPRTYLGDKVSSYGGYLRYRLHTQTMRGDAFLIVETTRPDIILKGNQMTLVYMEREYSSPEDPHEGIVHLVEESFRHAQTGNSVSREELMMVLVALESLQIRALHSQSAQSVSLHAAVLEAAENLPSGRHANNVEICLCPGHYLGDSCQQCAPGYYRDTKGLFLGKCVPCNCNSHSDQCLDGSGICVNCRHNTAGNHCEKCQGGFHGNNTVDGHAVSCSSCPCPLQVASNNFAIRCVEKPKHMQCLCMPGYAGSKCERCAPGYYGNPMVIGSTCQPCNCNGNSDSNMLFSDCHPLTGECQSCMHNSAGPHCEICAPGFYGDAITAKNCTRCSCSPCGTAHCDPHTGQCHCKPGVLGSHCDSCEDGAFGFDSCTGCRKCDCEAAAALVQPCDPANGSCACRPGVNGPNCRQCAPGYWDYSPNGCKKCECRGGRCDPRTGECRCTTGLTGKQCDTCLSQHSVLVQHGADVHCQPCDSCVMVLLEDLDKINQLYQSVANQLTSLNASSMAWTQLNRLNASMEDIANAITNYNSTLDESRNRADLLEGELQVIDSDIKELEEKASVTQKKGDALEDNTNSTHTRAQDLLGFIKGIMGGVQDIILQVNRTAQNETKVTDDKDLAGKIAEVESMLRDMRFRGFDFQMRQAGNELERANKLVDRVKNEVANRTVNNEAVAENIKNKLNQFNQQLMDLRDALNQAVNNTAHTVEANNNNQKRMEEVQKIINNLREKQKEVEDLKQMAEDDVTQVNDLLSMLQDSKEDYERLAAQLDGARQPLAEKVQKYAPSAKKIPLVEAAEKHAEMLDQLAKNLSSLISGSNQDGFIQRALNASRAYTNIINSILESETAAKKANEASTEALENIKDKDLPLQAAALKNKSIELVKAAEELNNSSQSLKPRVDSVQKGLQDAEKKKEKMLQDLKNIQDNLNFSREDIANDITAAKSAVEQANNTMANVDNALAPIQKQLEEWQKQYGDSNATSDDINKALSDANKSVVALSDTLPQLMKKLDRLQNTSFQPSNISDSIQRIRQLIEKARNAANKVTVSMQFNGKSGVQVRRPSNVADLAAYSSLQMYIKLPRAARRRRQTETTKPQFVFYLGNKDSSKDYMAMMLEGTMLHWYFNVGGDTAQVLMTDGVNSEYFNKLVLERTLQYGQMAMSTDSEGTKTVKQIMEAGGENGLLNLPAEETVFYVGGYPRTFSPPVDLNITSSNFFKGCLELLSLNEELISLYNFEETFQMNTNTDLPCSRKRPSNTPEWTVDGVYFDGSGYVEVLFETLKDDRVFEQNVKLVSQNGILLSFQRDDKYVTVAVHGGLLKVFYNVEGTLSELSDPQQSKIKIGNAQVKFLDVIFQLSKSEMLVRLDRQKVYSLSSKELNFTGRYFLGGVPEDQMPESLKSVFHKRGSIKGCLRTIKALRSFVQIKTMKGVGISYGCPEDLLFTREAHFTGEGYLGLKMANVLDLPDNFYAGIGFRTDQHNGLMFYHQGQNDVCQVVLDSGHVVVSAGNKGVKSQKTYNDDNSHYVAFYRNTNGLRIYIDDVLESGGEAVSADTSRAALQSDITYVGGTPASNGLTNLTGCLSNFFMKRIDETKVVDLKSAQEGHKYTFVCPAASVPLEILDSPRRKNPKNKPQGSSRTRLLLKSCQGEVSVQEVDAQHFSGSSHSHLRFDSLPQTFSKAPHISLGVRVNSSSGLVFHAGEKGQRTMMLSVSDGHLTLQVNGGRRKTSIRSRKKYNDGLWHTVFVKVEGDRASLTADGIDTQNKRVTGGGKSQFGAPLYIGGLPSDHSAAEAGFVGCVRDLKLNELPAQSPSHSVGVTSCYQQPLQPGVHFSSQGGYLTIDESLMLGRDLEIQLEVRVVSDSGLLLHTGAKKTQQLSLYLNQGQVTVLVNSGSGEFSVSLTPEESLCDGGWHTVTIVKKSNVIQLHVDSASEHGVGPKQSRSNGGKETVYLGSIPDTIAVPGLPSTVLSFHGCVRKAVLNHRTVMLTKPSSVSGSVGTQGCPAL